MDPITINEPINGVNIKRAKLIKQSAKIPHIMPNNAIIPIPTY